MGLVGESGCGKTTLGESILRLNREVRGEVIYRNTNIIELPWGKMKNLRKHLQVVFQDPFGSLSPRMTILDIVGEGLKVHHPELGERETRKQVEAVLAEVGLPAESVDRYPHEFSGGQRQRISVARVLILRPEFIMLDEPTSALDVSVQAQVLNLLKDLQEELGLTYLFISHNLAVVDYVADRIAVMCAGRIVETAPRETLFQNPMHPYTQALLAAVPKADPGAKLDLTALMEGKASEPTAWPAPFTLDDGVVADMIDAGGGHFVRAEASAQLPREV